MSILKAIKDIFSIKAENQAFICRITTPYPDDDADDVVDDVKRDGGFSPEYDAPPYRVRTPYPDSDNI